jgi:hypothetical protein
MAPEEISMKRMAQVKTRHRGDTISESLHGNLSIQSGGALPLSHLGQRLFVIGIGPACPGRFQRCGHPQRRRRNRALPQPF